MYDLELEPVTDKPISEIATDIFTPLADSSIGMTGQDLDPYQSEPEQGSSIELGGQDTDVDTLNIASGVPRSVDVQNLTGQSDSPPLWIGKGRSDISGSGSAGASVPLDNGQEGTTEIGHNINVLGPALAAAVSTQVPQQATSPQTSSAGQVNLMQTSQSGLSFGANMVLFFVLGVIGSIVAYGIVKG